MFQTNGLPIRTKKNLWNSRLLLDLFTHSFLVAPRLQYGILIWFDFRIKNRNDQWHLHFYRFLSHLFCVFHSCHCCTFSLRVISLDGLSIRDIVPGTSWAKKQLCIGSQQRRVDSHIEICDNLWDQPGTARQEKWKKISTKNGAHMTELWLENGLILSMQL